MPFGLEESDIKTIHKIFSSYPQIKKSIIYGSRAKGNYRRGSDIDLVLYGGKDLDLGILYGIMEDSDDRFRVIEKAELCQPTTPITLISQA